ncbi:MAG: hypothetical protein U9O89_05255 [Thermoproteota archaeon]|nr:hypothetical protein [Thermoproteota archaeon]
MLEEDANFTVRYIKDVTISFYEKLPTYGYGLIILRIHSAVRKDTDLVDFFTNEPYKKGKYNKPGISMATIFDNKTFFAIGPDFVEKTMNGVFENSVIIATGCNGTTYLTMGRALKDKGASVYIGWNGYVDPNYADAATEQLLKHLLLENQTVADSVSAIDSDPRWNSELEYYPHEIGDLKIRKKKQGITGLNSALISVLKMLGETLKTSEVCMGRRFNFEDCFLSPRIVY